MLLVSSSPCGFQRKIGVHGWNARSFQSKTCVNALLNVFRCNVGSFRKTGTNVTLARFRARMRRMQCWLLSEDRTFPRIRTRVARMERVSVVEQGRRGWNVRSFQGKTEADATIAHFRDGMYARFRAR